MLSFTASQASLVASDHKNVMWSFYIVDTNDVVYTYRTEPLDGVEWDADIDWVAGTEWDDGRNLSSNVITGFGGIELRRNSSEGEIIAPSDVTFNISNQDSTITFSDLKGGSVLIELYLDNTTYGTHKITGWKFRIKSSSPGYQNLEIVAEDFLQYYLRGDYPNTRKPEDIFPSNLTYERDDLCLPVPFGTAYVPLRDIFIDGTIIVTDTTIAAVASASGARCQFTDSNSGFGLFEQGRTITVSGFTETENNGTFIIEKVTAGIIEIAYDAGLVDEVAGDTVTISHGTGYLMLGDITNTYTITKIRSPRSWGTKSEYTSGSYTFTQATKADADANDWRVFQAIIADIDGDDTADAPGFWMPTDTSILDPPVEFTRSDTATMTNPADVIEFVLEDMGIPSAMIDATTFAAAAAVYDGWGLTYNGAFWYKQSRQKVLAQLLTQCHSCLRVGETIELHELVKASQQTITDADVLRTSDQGGGTFNFRDLANEDYTDAGYVQFQESGEAQDEMSVRVLISADAVANVVSNETIQCPFVQDTQDIQRIGKLHYQRKFLREAEITARTKSACLGIQPDDVVTLNEANYGGNYTVLVDSVKINQDISIDLRFFRYASS